MTQKKSRRASKVQNLDIPLEELGAEELKKIRGGVAESAKQLDSLTQGGGPTAAQNQKIQVLTFNQLQTQKK